MSLTPKQEAFCHEYMIDLNATQAAIRVGYSEKTAFVQGSRLLSNAKIAAFLQQLMNERSNRTDITKDRILKEYARIGFFDPRKLFTPDGKLKKIHELDDDTAAVIAGIEVTAIPGTSAVLHKIKFIDKRGSLDSMAKHIGMFDERKQLPNDVPATEDYTLKPDEAPPHEPIL